MKVESVAEEKNIVSGSMTCLSNPSIWSQVVVQAVLCQAIQENVKQIFTRHLHPVAVESQLVSNKLSVAVRRAMTYICPQIQPTQ